MPNTCICCYEKKEMQGMLAVLYRPHITPP